MKTSKKVYPQSLKMKPQTILIRILLIDFFSDHPNCNEIDSLIGYDFPIEEYNINYYPILITTKIFSHKFVFAEIESKD